MGGNKTCGATGPAGRATDLTTAGKSPAVFGDIAASADAVASLLFSRSRLVSDVTVVPTRVRLARAAAISSTTPR